MGVPGLGQVTDPLDRVRRHDVRRGGGRRAAVDHAPTRDQQRVAGHGRHRVGRPERHLRERSPVGADRSRVVPAGPPVQPARSTATAATASARLMDRGCHRCPAAQQAGPPAMPDRDLSPGRARRPTSRASRTLRILPVTVIGKSSTTMHVARDLVVRELAGGELPDRVGVERLGAGLHLDPGAELLAVLLVGDADHLDVLDVGVGVEELLDLARVDVLAAADHHVLDPADDVAVAVLAHLGEVAGVHPAVGVDRLGGLLRLVPVAEHHRVAAGAELPGSPALDGLAGRRGRPP